MTNKTYKLITIHDILRLPDDAFERFIAEAPDALRFARAGLMFVSPKSYTMEWIDDGRRDQAMVVEEYK